MDRWEPGFVADPAFAGKTPFGRRTSGLRKDEAGRMKRMIPCKPPREAWAFSPRADDAARRRAPRQDSDGASRPASPAAAPQAHPAAAGQNPQKHLLNYLTLHFSPLTYLSLPDCVRAISRNSPRRDIRIRCVIRRVKRWNQMASVAGESDMPESGFNRAPLTRRFASCS